MSTVSPGSTAVEPFRIAVADALLDDLKARLANTRWPEAEPVADWSQGIPLAYTQELCRYWAQEYDWRKREAALNRFDQFRTSLDGGQPADALGIHFIHVRSPHEGALPLVLTHGWPGSVVEFHKVIEPLAEPTRFGGDAADAFHVVCPALPGYGFSDKPSATGWGVDRIAAAWAQLMDRLGYARYGAQGGDWGSAVTTAIGRDDPEHCVGIHLNMAAAGRDRSIPEEEYTQAERDALTAAKYYQDWDSGYSKEQSTRPQTVGYGLVDSPAAQAAWIVEKFWAWMDCGGHPENVLTRDELLDNVMLYWATASGASSARLYWESFRAFGDRRQITVPTGVAAFPKEILKTSRRWAARRYTDIRRWTEMPKGGHFAAFEQPELFVDDVRAFFRLVR
ncbi:MAG: epoxide hydrolase family protein [Acidimicrobiales bacterium]